jgi:hypothetical protein
MVFTLTRDALIKSGSLPRWIITRGLGLILASLWLSNEAKPPSEYEILGGMEMRHLTS